MFTLVVVCICFFYVDAQLDDASVMCCVFRSVNACLRMRSHGRKQWKTLKKYLKSAFLSYARETHVRLMQEHGEKCSFLAFRSDSQTLVDTQ